MQKQIVLNRFLFFIYGEVCAQKVQCIFLKLDVNKGLSQNQNNCFLKDRKGFIWMGTNSGLNRFDGYAVKLNFAIIVGAEDPNSLSSLQLFPNPTKGDIHTDFPSAGISKAELMKTTVRAVLSQAIEDSQTSTD